MISSLPPGNPAVQQSVATADPQGSAGACTGVPAWGRAPALPLLTSEAQMGTCGSQLAKHQTCLLGHPIPPSQHTGAGPPQLGSPGDRQTACLSPEDGIRATLAPTAMPTEG